MPILLNRDVSFYGSPITKCFVLLTSTTTLFSTLLVFNPTNATVKTLWHVLRSCSFPSVGTWVMGVVLMYWTRPLERHLGSVKFVRVTFTSCLLSLSLYVLSLSSLHLILNDNITSTLLSHHINFMFVGTLVAQFVLSVRGNSLLQFHQLHISSHSLIILLLSALTASVPSSAIAVLCGGFGGALSWLLKPLPLPSSLLTRLVGLVERLVVEKQPELLSGATISVQRQQQMDILEGFVMNLQQRRQHHQHQQHGTGGFVPHEDQVRQLTMMGFRQDEAREALIASQGQVHHAVQLLTTNSR